MVTPCLKRSNSIGRRATGKNVFILASLQTSVPRSLRGEASPMSCEKLILVFPSAPLFVVIMITPALALVP